MDALPCTDVRQALYNDQAVGPINKIQLPAVRITRLHGILFDLDPKILIPGNTIFSPADTPEDFHVSITPVLERHPLARFAEVRASGTGLHLILWMLPPVELMASAEQRRWGAIVKAIQRTLPIDPDMPGITAVTRQIGSINSRNGAIVKILRAGEPVDPQVVEKYIATLAASPFCEIALPLLGQQRVSPCPVCRAAGSRLDVLDHLGMCYGNCGKVKLPELFDVVLQSRNTQSTTLATQPPETEQTGGLATS